MYNCLLFIVFLCGINDTPYIAAVKVLKLPPVKIISIGVKKLQKFPYVRKLYDKDIRGKLYVY